MHGYSIEDVRFLGIQSDRMYVFGRNVLQDHPGLRALCCDHYDLEDLLRQEGLLTGKTLETAENCLYVYFKSVTEAYEFLAALNKFILDKHKGTAL